MRRFFTYAIALLVTAIVVPTAQAQQTTLDKSRALRRGSPFNLGAGVNLELEANLVNCGINNEGAVCSNVFNSPTGGGGYWPSGTANQYIFNSGLMIAGIMGADAPATGVYNRGDTVGSLFFNAIGTGHGDPLTNVFNSLDAADLENWPERGIANDTALFNAALIGSRAVSDQDSYVEYWDGDPNKLNGREHPMGVRVEQRSMAFNAPAGAEHTLFFIYKFTNVTNEPSFQVPSEQKFGQDLPDAGWTIDSIYAAFGMDPDVTTHFRENYATAILPFQLGIAYKGDFTTDDFDFANRADLYAPPFFPGVGFVGVKFLRSPVNPTTGQQIGLTMFGLTTNSAVFPDPDNVAQLFRYLKGDTRPAQGDQHCTFVPPESINRRLCTLVQQEDDARFYQASGPFSLGPGQSATIVVAYTHGAPVAVPGVGTPGNTILPGIPSRRMGTGTDTLRTVERVAGVVSVPATALVTTPTDTFVDQRRVNVVPRSLLSNALVAQTIFDNKFLLPRPPEPPEFSLVPGDNQVTVVWAPSRTETVGDPYFNIASQPTVNGGPNALFNPNYRRFDVEGYRIYRQTGLRGGFELLAQFDKTGTAITDVTCELDPDFVPAEGQPCEVHDVQLVGPVVQFPAGGRVRDAATGAVLIFDADTVAGLEDTGVPFAFVDNDVRNGITYSYIVTAFDVNSLQSGASSLESPRVSQFVTPRKDPTNMVMASFTSSVTNAQGQALPTISEPTVNTATGIFSGPQPPTNGLDATFAPIVERLLPAFNLKATIDSMQAFTPQTHPAGCPNGAALVGGVETACWRVYMTIDRDGTQSRTFTDGFTPVWWVFGDHPPQCVHPQENSAASGCAEVQFAIGQVRVDPDPATASQFSLPSDFPGFNAVVSGIYPQSIMYSSVEGQHNRRDAGLGAFASGADVVIIGFGAGDRVVAGGSRWFSGANETVADPTRLIRVGHLDGVDTVWAPIHHTPTAAGATANANGNGYSNQYPGSAQMQCFSYIYGQLSRAADVRFVFGAAGAATVTDVTHNTPVIFKPTAQVSWGFLTTDANGNGVIDWADFNYIENVSQALGTGRGLSLGCGHTDVAAARIQLSQTLPATLPQVSTSGAAIGGSFPAEGTGFGLYINGERYIFRVGAVPAANTTWTLRTYVGLLRSSASTSLTLDPASYAWRGDLVHRPPTVTGLTFNAVSTSASGPQGEFDITRVHTVPDPYYVRSQFELGPSNKALRFVNVPPQAIIRIYSLNGTLVRILEHNDPLGGAEAQWDLRNRNNQFVASGVYFYVVEGADGKKFTGKFTVVQFAR